MASDAMVVADKAKKMERSKDAPAEAELAGAFAFTGAAVVSGGELMFTGEDAGRQRGLVRQLVLALGPTKEWAENNYYHRRIGAQNEGLIPVNAFWRDYAAWDGKAPFLSPNLTVRASKTPVSFCTNTKLRSRSC